MVNEPLTTFIVKKGSGGKEVPCAKITQRLAYMWSDPDPMWARVWLKPGNMGGALLLKAMMLFSSVVGRWVYGEAASNRAELCRHRQGFGWSNPLYIASEEGHLDVVRLLVEQRADINKASNDGGTPLLIASSKGRVDVVRVLLEHGADANKAKKDGSLLVRSLT